MYIVNVQKAQLLNQLLQRLPPGVLVDSRWLQGQGLSRSGIHAYVERGWLERVPPRLYTRPNESRLSEPIRWQLAVVSAQALSSKPFHIGGPTALDLLGLSHFLDLGRTNRAWLYDANRTAPTWLEKLDVDAELLIRRKQLFTSGELGIEWRPFESATGRVGAPVTEAPPRSLWKLPLRMSGVERATIELLEEVGSTVGFKSADTISEGLANLRPRLLDQLLKSCTSVKAKRLFFFFADRHQHAWARHLEPAQYELGSGKRQVVKGGRLHPKYQITVPADMMPDGEEQDGS